MSEAAANFESLLREALTPVDPPEDLVERLEGALLSITEMAADELDAWELSAMRDPRNWVRPATAVLAGGAAGTALVVLRARRRAAQHSRSRLAGALDLGSLGRSAETALRDFEREARRLLGER